MAHLEMLDAQENVKGILELIEEGQFVIGRDEGCDFSMMDGRLSRRHAAVSERDGAFEVEDLGSTNGVKLDGERVTGARLRDGQILEIGPLRFRFRSDGSALSQDADEPLPDAPTSTARETALDPSELEGAVSEAADEVRRRLEVLLQMATVLDSFSTPEQLLERIGRMVVEVLAPSSCLIEVQGERWGCGAASIEVSATVVRRVRERGQALLLDELEDEPVVQIPLGGQERTLHSERERDPDWRERSARRLGIRSAMGAPVLRGPEVIGLVYADWRSGDRHPFGRDDLLLLIAVGRLLSATLAGSERLERAEARSRMQRESSSQAGTVVGESAAMLDLRRTIERRIGPVRSNVLLIGETGTGKTMMAEAVHLASPRRCKPFLKINCAAIPRELIESELFGHERGAFSGALQRKIGQFEAAAGGTLFLDEIGELDPAAQSKLLTVVHDRAVLRVGSVTPIEVDVRLIAATSRDLEREVQEGRFRPDLFYRLNVVRLEIPPLRDRVEDIPLLAHHLLRRACHQIGRQISGFDDDTMEALRCYRWPGNVRELANAIEHAVIFADEGGQITVDLLPPEVRASSGDRLELDVVARKERELVEQALDRAGGNKREAARLLGWYPQKLYNRIKRYGLEE